MHIRVLNAENWRLLSLTFGTSQLIRTILKNVVPLAFLLKSSRLSLENDCLHLYCLVSRTGLILVPMGGVYLIATKSGAVETDCDVVDEQEFNRGTDEWVILDELSPGCDGPTYAEEIIL